MNLIVKACGRRGVCLCQRDLLKLVITEKRGEQRIVEKKQQYRFCYTSWKTLKAMKEVGRELD